MMRIGNTLRAVSLATGIPRDWNAAPALWSCAQMKAFLVMSPSCALCAVPRAQVQLSGASMGVCAGWQGDLQLP